MLPPAQVQVHYAFPQTPPCNQKSVKNFHFLLTHPLQTLHYKLTITIKNKKKSPLSKKTKFSMRPLKPYRQE